MHLINFDEADKQLYWIVLNQSVVGKQINLLINAHKSKILVFQGSKSLTTWCMAVSNTILEQATVNLCWMLLGNNCIDQKIGRKISTGWMILSTAVEMRIYLLCVRYTC